MEQVGRSGSSSRSEAACIPILTVPRVTAHLPRWCAPCTAALSPTLCRVEVLSVGETMNRSREVLQRPFARLLLFGSVSRPLVSEVVTRTYLAGAPIALGVVSLPTAKAWVSSRCPDIAYCGRRLTLKRTVGCF